MPVYVFEFAAKPPDDPQAATLLLVTVEIQARTDAEAVDIFKREVQLRDRARFKPVGAYEKHLNYYAE